MKRIAIDCRSLTTGRTGIGRYLYEILKELAHMQDDVQYYLYAHKPIDCPEECQNNQRFVIRIKRLRPSMLWLQTVIPIWIARDKIDVFWGPNYAMPVIWLRKCKKVITIHDATFFRFPETMKWSTRLHINIMLSVYCRKVDRILTVSNFSRNEITEALNVNHAIVRVTLLASRPRRVDGKTRNIVENPYILCVGTMEPRKNQEALVRAYSSLPKPLRDAYSLIFVGGDGWGGLSPEEWFEKYGVRGRVLGRVEEEELWNLYSNATLFVFPSLYEGFGLPVLEAMSVGTPVLCTRGSSLDEVGGDAVAYFDPISSADLSRQLTTLLNDPDLRAELSGLGRKRAQLFSWAKTARETVVLLLEEGV